MLDGNKGNGNLRVSADAMFLAKFLLLRAVDLGQLDALFLERCSRLLVLGLQRLAVTTPAGLKGQLDGQTRRNRYTHQGAKNSTRMGSSGWTILLKLSLFKSITSESTSASASVAAANLEERNKIEQSAWINGGDEPGRECTENKERLEDGGGLHDGGGDGGEERKRVDVDRICTQSDAVIRVTCANVWPPGVQGPSFQGSPTYEDLLTYPRSLMNSSHVLHILSVITLAVNALRCRLPFRARFPFNRWAPLAGIPSMMENRCQLSNLKSEPYSLAYAMVARRHPGSNPGRPICAETEWVSAWPQKYVHVADFFVRLCELPEPSNSLYYRPP